MREHLKSTVFKRYVFSYLIVFLIPFMILFILLNIVYIRSLYQETMNTYETNIRQISLQLDADVNEMDFVSDQINQSNLFSSVRLNSNTQPNTQLESLRRYEIGSNTIQDIYVILREDNVVYSSKGTLPMYGLLNNTRHFDVVEEEKEELLDVLSSTEGGLSTFTLDTVNSSNLKNKIVYHTSPLHIGNRNIGTLVIVASTNNIDFRMNIAGADHDISLLANEKNEIVYNYGLSNEYTLDLERMSSQRIHRIGDKWYTAIVMENASTGWQVINLFELSRVFQPLLSSLMIFSVLLIVIFIIGVILSNYFAKKNYKPLQEIVQNFGSNEYLEEITGDEWTYIEKNVQLVQEERSRLENQIKMQQEVFRNTALNRLLEGNFPNESHILNQLDEVGIHFPYRSFAVSILKFGEDSLETDSLAKVEELVSFFNTVDLSTYDVSLHAMVSFLKNNIVYVLVNSDHENIEQLNNNLINELKNTTITDQPIVAASSNMHSNIMDINQAFIEASATLEDLTDTETADDYIIGYFYHTKQDETKIDFSSVTRFYRDDYLLLTQSIKQANNQVAFSIVDRLFDSLDSKFPEDFTNQLLYTTLVGAVIKAGDEVNISLENILGEPSYDLTDVEDMRRTIKDMIMVTSEEIKSRQEQDDTELENKVVSYVYEHFASSTISLEEIASEYNISTSYVSKLISEETGESFTQILQKLRMDYFKELLVTTDRPIKELVKEIGYYDVSNFTRKFREENDVTPSKYRKMNKQK